MQAPAAFGLATFLLHEGFDRPRIRRHLALFSAAAPVLAMTTYFGLSGVRKDDIIFLTSVAIYTYSSSY